ncbi:PREDICTED: uncharacterized protein LOC105462604 [Wasmannia auropunctata]|uniref:uncharacterized protein LOC105462604 n=1 Tax=Wasmannia auropunctata TaxID=64793 RepID=UPI0005EE2280|nr:PREDICTED: uncharacterized protein LOC105462604 [Wasmannia auropunctata]
MNYYVPLKDEVIERPIASHISETPRILGRRFALTSTNFKYLDIGISVGSISYVEILIGDNRGNHIILFHGMWKIVICKKLDKLIRRRINVMPPKPQAFPLTSVEEVNHFNDISDEDYENVVEYFKFLGGLTLHDTIKYCFKERLTDETIRHFSAWGERGNLPLSTTKLIKAVYDVKTVVSESLNVFLEKVIVSKKVGSHEKWKIKCTSIAHAIISAARPRSFLSPLQIGLAAFLNKKYASRKLLEVLSALGFCSSYQEAVRLEISAIMRSPISIDSQSFSQFVFDNADFNTQTLDGLNTFHAMGGIQCLTPSTAIAPDQKIERLTFNATFNAHEQCQHLKLSEISDLFLS